MRMMIMMAVVLRLEYLVMVTMIMTAMMIAMVSSACSQLQKSDGGSCADNAMHTCFCHRLCNR